tara:strand:- start:2463 stop:3122 length:660 start_codon:yes stop_codon:yes gene_type:complete
MGVEINLLKNYPKTKRNTKDRAEKKSKEDIAIARKFDKEYFDGDRRYGYGGYQYNSKFWEPVVPDFIKHFNLSNNSSILDVGCGKGFALYDFKKALPGLEVQGIDISNYAIDNAKEEVRSFLTLGNATNLPYPDNYFDCVISIVTLHNLDRADCAKGLSEIERVSKGKSFITLDAYADLNEKKLMEEWNLTALTVMHVDDWKKFFEENNFNGDYYWFKP